MQSDLPHVLYLKDKKRDGGKQNTVASEEVIRLQEEANRKAAERRRKAQGGQGEKVYQLEELYK